MCVLPNSTCQGKIQNTLPDRQKVINQYISITFCISVSDEGGELTRELLTFGDQFDLATTIQLELSQLLDKIKQSLDKIWLEATHASDNENGMKFGPQATTQDIIGKNANKDHTYVPQYQILGKICALLLHKFSQYTIHVKSSTN